MKFGSLFSGMGGFELSLKNTFKDEAHCEFFSEIDKPAIEIFTKNFPKNKGKNLGNIERTLFDLDRKNRLIPNEFRISLLPDIDILVGGSPCQDLSIATKDRKSLDGEKSRLFYAFLEILRIKMPKYFLLENVGSMNKESQDTITRYLGVEPVRINSSDFSGQKRDRLYWFNWPYIEPESKIEISFNSILEKNPSLDSISVPKLDKEHFSSIKDYMKCPLETIAMGWSKSTRYPKDKPKFVENRVSVGKSNCLTTGIGCGNQSTCNYVFQNGIYRYITPVEGERLQTFPDGWTEGVSKSQRYKLIGNSVTVSVIDQILGSLKRYLDNNNNQQERVL